MNSLKTWFKKVNNYLIPKISNINLRLPSLSGSNISSLGVDEHGTLMRIVTLNGNSYKGEIDVNTDFPELLLVVEGDWYSIINYVTDDAGDPYTNTNQSFDDGDTIYWTGTEWKLYYNTNVSMPIKFIMFDGNNIQDFIYSPLVNIVNKGDYIEITKPFEYRLLYIATVNNSLADDDYWFINRNPIQASNVTTDVSNFNNILSNADTTVQQALETLDTKSLTTLTENKVWMGNNGNLPEEVETMFLNFNIFSIDDDDYVILKSESSWCNNVSTSVTGQLGDFIFGENEFGIQYFIYYRDNDWIRISNNYNIDANTTAGSLLINEVTSNTAFNSSNYTYSASKGDLNQCFTHNNYMYQCINGVNHTWIRTKLLKDINEDFIPKLITLSDVINGDTFVIPPMHYIISVVFSNLTPSDIGKFTLYNDSFGDDYATGNIGNFSNKCIAILQDGTHEVFTSSNNTFTVDIDNPNISLKLEILIQKISND